MSPEPFLSWKPDQVFSLEHDVFPEFVKSKKLKACIIDGDFIDIGVPEDYLFFSTNVEKYVGHD